MPISDTSRPRRSGPPAAMFRGIGLRTAISCRNGLEPAMFCRSGLQAAIPYASGLRTATGVHLRSTKSRSRTQFACTAGSYGGSGLPQRAITGFTLLEMMVVMAIIALAMGIVLPRLATMADSFGAASERETVIESVASLGLLARARGRALRFTGQSELLPGEMPEGWRVVPDQPITFHASGACDGGQVRVIGREREFLYRLDPPRCRVTLVN